jgi:hypothetical protein
LIDKEEQIGKEKMWLRLQKIERRHPAKYAAAEPLDVPKKEKRITTASSTQSRHVHHAQQQPPLDGSYNGPCVVCLEPDAISGNKLQALRHLLQHTLANGTLWRDGYSPTGSFTATAVAPGPPRPADPSAYRPVVPIAAFPTVTSAIAVARQLRQLWEPLTFNVTDLHVLSQCPLGSTATARTREDSAAPWGCDALVSLMGSNTVNDDAAAVQEMIQVVCEMGEPGGYYNVPNRSGADVSSIERWLWEDEEEYDAGTVVVMGRSQFFTGEMRTYVGMPASCVLDGRDTTAYGTTFVSGAARRRTVVHRSGTLYQDGDWGQKSMDYEPWGMRERTKRKLRKNRV